MKKNVLFLIFFLFIYIKLYSQNWTRFPGPVSSDVVSAQINKNGLIVISTYYDEVYLSNDKGVNWEQINSGLNLNQPRIDPQIHVSPTGEFYLTYNQFLYLFNAQTKTWQIQNNFIKNLSQLYFDDNGDIYYSTGNSVSRSIDNGKIFQGIAYFSNRSIIGFAEDGINTIYISCKSSSNLKELYSLNKDGKNLKLLSSNIPGQKLYYNKSTSTLFSIHNYQIFSSLNGTNWTYNSLNNLSNITFNEMLFLKDKRIVCFTNLGLFQSLDNGITWNRLNVNIGKLDPIYMIGISTTDANDIFFHFNYSLNIINNLNTFQDLSHTGNIASFNYIQSSINGDLLIRDNEKTFLSNDSGKNWQLVDVSESNYYTLNSDGTCYQTRPIIKYSTDKTISWKSIQSPIKQNYYIFINKKNNILIYPIQQSQNSYYYSNNYGKNWINIKLPEPFNYLFLSNNDILYGYNPKNEFFYSHDIGKTWKKINLNNGNNIYPLLLSDNNILYWGERTNQQSRYYSMDFGKTNIRIPNDLQYTEVDEEDNFIDINPLDSSLTFSNLFQLASFKISMTDIPTRSRYSLFGGNITKDGYIYLTGDNSGVYKSNNKWFETKAKCNGLIFKDVDQNCQLDLSKDIQYPFKIKLTNTITNQEWFTSSSNFASFNLGLFSGDYTIQLAENPKLWQACNFPSTFSIKDGDHLNLGSLLVKPLELCTQMSIDIAAGIFRRCFDNNSARITIRNTGTEDAINQKVTVVLDPFWENVRSSFPISSQNINIAQYIIPLIPAGGEFEIDLTFVVSCNASLGQSHCLKATIVDAKKCTLIDPIVDSYQFCQPNRGSFDPNDKQAFENGQAIDTFTNQNSTIDYLIRFQNTGTDTAFNVKITDQLDSNLDWSSLTVASSSHDYSYEINPNGFMTILFRNILLADKNINELASHGFFKYSIKQKKDLLSNTEIKNSASIYFDFNNPIITNSVDLKVKIITQAETLTEGHEIIAIPNPFKESTILYFPDIMHNDIKSVSICDLEGRILSKFNTQKDKLTIQNLEYGQKSLIVQVISESGLKSQIKLLTIK